MKKLLIIIALIMSTKSNALDNQLESSTPWDANAKLELGLKLYEEYQDKMQENKIKLENLEKTIDGVANQILEIETESEELEDIYQDVALKISNKKNEFTTKLQNYYIVKLTKDGDEAIETIEYSVDRYISLENNQGLDSEEKVLLLKKHKENILNSLETLEDVKPFEPEKHLSSWYYNNHRTDFRHLFKYDSSRRFQSINRSISGTTTLLKPLQILKYADTLEYIATKEPITFKGKVTLFGKAKAKFDGKTLTYIVYSYMNYRSYPSDNNLIGLVHSLR